MSKDEWWYTQDEFPDEIPTEEVLRELMRHWSSISASIRGHCDLLLDLEPYKSDEVLVEIGQNILIAAELFDFNAWKARDYLDRKPVPIDLTPQLLGLLDHAPQWKASGFTEVLRQFSDESNWEIQWDEGVPEHWVGIGQVASISTDLPLVFVLQNYEKPIRRLIPDDVLVVAVEDWNIQKFSIDQDQYSRIFPGGESEVLEPHNFTISELVYATIS